MTDVDPTDTVKALLEGASAPMSTEEIVQALAGTHHAHEVEQALDFWRREHAAVQGEDGRWSWHTLRFTSS